jgi:hypothetical protein
LGQRKKIGVQQFLVAEAAQRLRQGHPNQYAPVPQQGLIESLDSWLAGASPWELNGIHGTAFLN